VVAVVAAVAAAAGALGLCWRFGVPLADSVAGSDGRRDLAIAASAVVGMAVFGAFAWWAGRDSAPEHRPSGDLWVLVGPTPGPG
jgi:hypothetical protein